MKIDEPSRVSTLATEAIVCLLRSTNIHMVYIYIYTELSNAQRDDALGNDRH
jgi:hypothetical protein